MRLFDAMQKGRLVDEGPDIGKGWVGAERRANMEGGSAKRPPPLGIPGDRGQARKTDLGAGGGKDLGGTRTPRITGKRESGNEKNGKETDAEEKGHFGKKRVCMTGVDKQVEFRKGIVRDGGKRNL